MHEWVGLADDLAASIRVFAASPESRMRAFVDCSKARDRRWQTYVRTPTLPGFRLAPVAFDYSSASAKACLRRASKTDVRYVVIYGAGGGNDVSVRDMGGSMLEWICAECGKQHSGDPSLVEGGAWYCDECKPRTWTCSGCGEVRIISETRLYHRGELYCLDCMKAYIFGEEGEGG